MLFVDGGVLKCVCMGVCMRESILFYVYTNLLGAGDPLYHISSNDDECALWCVCEFIVEFYHSCRNFKLAWLHWSDLL